MNNVMGIGLSGLEASAARFGAAASRIVTAMSAMPSRATSNQTPAGQQQGNGANQNSLAQNNQAMNVPPAYNQNGSTALAMSAHTPSYEIDLNPAASGDNLPRDIAAMKMASIAYRANLNTLAAARKMFNATLDILA